MTLFNQQKSTRRLDLTTRSLEKVEYTPLKRSSAKVAITRTPEKLPAIKISSIEVS